MLIVPFLLSLTTAPVAPTIVHQVLVIELPEDLERPETLFLSDAEAKSLALRLSKDKARVISAPALLGRENEPTEIDVKSAESSLHIALSVLRARTHVEFRWFQDETRLEAKADLDLRDGVTFALPIDSRRILIGRQDRLEADETVEGSMSRWRETWHPLLEAR